MNKKTYWYYELILAGDVLNRGFAKTSKWSGAKEEMKETLLLNFGRDTKIQKLVQTTKKNYTYKQY